MEESVVKQEFDNNQHEYFSVIFCMILIAHRGNLRGPLPKRENTVDYILEAIQQGFDCEIDVHYIGHTLFLGHDTPDYNIPLSFLLTYADKLWIHCKNAGAIGFLSSFAELNIFWHQSDDFTLTKHGFIWCFPEKYTEVPAGQMRSICLMPEHCEFESVRRGISWYGVCSDYVGQAGELWEEGSEE